MNESRPRKLAPPDPATVVRDWERPMFDLSRRLLRNEADARDATQEVFVALLRDLPGYDPTRPFAPWIYRLATNVILNSKRAASRRRRREEAAAVPIQIGDPPGEGGELRALLEEQVALLPESEALLVVMHYYHGVSKSDIAESLDLPRTTVQSRIARALGALRQSLQGSGFLVAIPGMESAMRATPMARVPAELSAALATLVSASSASAAVVTTGLTVGGVVVTNKLLTVVLVALSIVSVLAGFGMARVVGGAAVTDPDPVAASVDADGAVARLERELETLRAHVARLQGESERLTRALTEAQSENQVLAERLAARATDSAEPPVAADPEDEFLASIDWEVMRECMLIQVEAEERGEDLGALPPQLQSRFIGEMMKLMQHYQLDVSDMKIQRHGKLFVRMLELTLPEGQRFTKDDARLVIEASADLTDQVSAIDAEGLTVVQYAARERRLIHEAMIPVLEGISLEADLSLGTEMFSHPIGLTRLVRVDDRAVAVALHLDELGTTLELTDDQRPRVRSLIEQHAAALAGIPGQLRRHFDRHLVDWYYGVGDASIQYEIQPSRGENPDWPERERRDYVRLISTANLAVVEAVAALHDELQHVLTTGQWQRLASQRGMTIWLATADVPQ